MSHCECGWACESVKIQKIIRTACINLEGIMLSEINQMEKDKYHMISLVCGILKVKQTTHPDQNPTKLTEDGLVIARVREGGLRGLRGWLGVGWGVLGAWPSVKSSQLPVLKEVMGM